MKHQMEEKVLKPSQSGLLVSGCNALFESHLSAIQPCIMFTSIVLPQSPISPIHFH